MIGKIKWFNLDKGYGYIIGYDDTTYYFEVNNLLCDIKDIKPNIEVKFIPNSYTYMEYADKIILYN